MRFPLGQPVRISTTVRDITGTLVNAGTITLSVLKPDATTQPYSTPTNDGTGLYHQDIPTTDLTLLGHYAFKWVSTGTGAGVSYGSLDVFDPLDVAVLPLQDAKDHLNIPSATTTYDAEIQGWIDTIQANLENYSGGPILNRQITERVEVAGRFTTLVLRRRPLVSVQSITDVAASVAISTADLELDTNAGVIRRKLGWPFYAWGPAFTVVYTAGWGTVVPAGFASAARIIIRHLWDTQHGPSSRPTMGGEEMATLPGFGFAIPNRAVELLAPYTLEAFV